IDDGFRGGDEGVARGDDLSSAVAGAEHFKNGKHQRVGAVANRRHRAATAENREFAGESLVLGAADEARIAHHALHGGVEFRAMPLILLAQIDQRNEIRGRALFLGGPTAHAPSPKRLRRSPKPMVTGIPVAIDSLMAVTSSSDFRPSRPSTSDGAPLVTASITCSR